MCAIAGVIGKLINEEDERRLLRTMSKRGPDGEGTYKSRDCILLHTRLAIIDPSGGAQPMTLQQGSRKFVIIYNGELYNTAELRGELEALGCTFCGHSDTEVLLHAYAQWGADTLERLNGIYSFAVWEEHNRRLFVARDRMGVKPFFYILRGDAFLFASEIKSLLAVPGVKARLGEEGISQLILLGPGRVPGSGVLEDIYELEPGCCGYFSNGVLTVSRYWQLRDRHHTESFEETVETVRWLVKDAITRQMVSDVPIGAFLSGGLDSSIISAVCASRSSTSLDTFSVDYLDNEKYFVAGKFQPESDAEYIKLMVKELGSCHHETILSPQALVDELEEATRARDLPGMADVDFSLLAFCKQISPRVKVALSGECADEIFGGYPWFRDPDIRDTEGFPWSQNASYRASFLLKPRIEYVREQYLDSLKQCDVLPGTDPVEKRIKELVFLNMKWFMQTLLDRKDRMSMYCGLEVRVPFCDHRIAEYLYGVPWAYKDHCDREKGLLRTAMEGILPQRVLWRKKSPYPKTHDPDYSRLIRERLERLLSRNDSPIFEFINKSAVRVLLENEQQTPWYGQLMRRAQTMAYLLQIDFWMREYNISLV